VHRTPDPGEKRRHNDLHSTHDDDDNDSYDNKDNKGKNDNRRNAFAANGIHWSSDC
jgi:hypothetical protein